GGTVSYSAVGLPQGLTISASTGEISGTLAVGSDSSTPYTVTVTATDGILATSTTFSWLVNHLSLSNPGPQSSVAGTTVSLALVGHDADGDSLAYSAVGLPTGLTISSSTGEITGTLGTAANNLGWYSVTVTVSDGTNATSQTFLWQVAAIGLTNPGDQTT